MLEYDQLTTIEQVAVEYTNLLKRQCAEAQDRAKHFEDKAYVNAMVLETETKLGEDREKKVIELQVKVDELTMTLANQIQRYASLELELTYTRSSLNKLRRGTTDVPARPVKRTYTKRK